MSDVHLTLALQSLRRMAPGVDGELPGATAQEPNAAAVADADKEIQI